VYNYTDKKYLSHYTEGVEISQKIFNKSDYKNIGLATDGLRYIFDKEYEQEFIRLLEQNKESAIKRLINREHKHFKDDITIVI
jgi:serine/threonine protein phosphatase PrpC